MPPAHIDDMSIIIVNYRSARALERCLRDLARLSGADRQEIIVVNNDTAVLSPPLYPYPLRIINIPTNIGFGPASNRGLALATRPFTLFLNPDTHSFSPNFLRLSAACDNDKTLIAPLIRGTDGAPQPWSCGNAVTCASIIGNNLRLHASPWRTMTPHTVRWISGGALGGATAFLRALGGFDEDFFLYFEDVDLCERAWRSGGHVRRDPRYTLTHSGGVSTRQSRAFQKTCYYTSQDLFIRKHRGPLQAALVRALRVLHPHS